MTKPYLSEDFNISDKKKSTQVSNMMLSKPNQLKSMILLGLIFLFTVMVSSLPSPGNEADSVASSLGNAFQIENVQEKRNVPAVHKKNKNNPQGRKVVHTHPQGRSGPAKRYPV